MSKRTTPNAFGDHTLMFKLRSADYPDVMPRTALSMPKRVRIATAASIDAPAAPELPLSRSVRLRATWRKAEGGGLVCHWTTDQE